MHTECRGRGYEKRMIAVAETFCFVPHTHLPLATARWGRHECPITERDWSWERSGSPFNIHLLCEGSRAPGCCNNPGKDNSGFNFIRAPRIIGGRIVLPPPNAHLSTPGKCGCVGACRKGRRSLRMKPFKLLQNREIAYQGGPVTSLGSLKMAEGSRVDESEK